MIILITVKIGVSRIESIHFSNLMCFFFFCFYNLSQKSDWHRFGNVIKCRFNLIDKLKNTIIRNKNKDKIIIEDSKYNDILWNLNLVMNWPNANIYSEESMIKVFGIINEMWININDIFISKGKPISVTVCICKYYWKWNKSARDIADSNRVIAESQMKKMYKKYGKDQFLQIFGDIAVDKGNDPHGFCDLALLQEKWRYKNYKMPIKHKYCKPLETPKMWCSFSKTDLNGQGDGCRIDYCVKNAEYQREN